MRLQAGTVQYLVAPDVPLGENEVLPCCCVATSDLILT
ncbi:MAG: hypothetical protein U5L45_11820 [Saprospiraceae bacterium]|nr:hypothetical protein [Saprospiraceae bacterium]